MRSFISLCSFLILLLDEDGECFDRWCHMGSEPALVAG